MKKLIANFIIILTFMLIIIGCGSNSETQATLNTSKDFMRTNSLITDNNINYMNNEKEESTSILNENTVDNPKETNGTIVVYFSNTGTTKKVANYISEELNTDIFEIEAIKPYTSEDLNYNNSSSRANIEQNDINARPEIENKIQNIEQYNVIYLGYPIWWGQAPRIISTFLESYDFSEKTIIPFCTSHSSGIGSSDENLHSFVDNAQWISGKRFSSEVSESEILEWLKDVEKDIN